MMWQTILAVALFIIHSSAECDVCQQNQAACINSTSFYLCFEDQQPDRSALYHCQKGFDCTDLNAICVQATSQRPPSCGDTSLCGLCSANQNYKFACLSRNTFRMCYGAIRPSGQVGYCPPGYVCYAGSNAICVSEKTITSVTCDIVDSGGLTTTPSAPTPTPSAKPTENPSSEILSATEVCEQQQAVGLYPTIPNDAYCKRYIYCFYSDGIMSGLEYNCYSGTYYHIQQQKCVFNKPSYCL